MKILSQEQIYEVDRETIRIQGISGLDLMERAANALFIEITSRYQDRSIPVYLFCGTGNNGGDGLALCRLLFEAGFKVKIFVVKFSSKVSPEFKANLEALSAFSIAPVFLSADSALPEIEIGGILIDAIFGIGLNRKPDTWVCALIQVINESEAKIISIDIPSGIPIGHMTEDRTCIVKSDWVLSLGVPKLSLFLPDYNQNIRQFAILDIGLDAASIALQDTPYELVDLNFARSLYKSRMRFSHKGTYGHVQAVGGSYGKIGAVLLASRASLSAGAGLVTAWIPDCGYPVLQTALPEVMVQKSGAPDYLDSFPENESSFTFIVGMGMGQHPRTREAFLKWLPVQNKPMVLDADALNLLSAYPDFLSFLPENCILTPHPGELKRLIGVWEDDYDKIERSFVFSERYKCILVVKGAFTMIFSRGKAFINSTGNPGMATGGSGDVLAGIIGAILAQQYHPLHAALVGVYIHGRAGDLNAADMGFEAVSASGIISYIGKAFKELYPDE
jgi:hydroxyethylthiazole kinase-like uncharacterized protein yjeF